jgi:Ca2+-binding EF-hand superfamily protein
MFRRALVSIATMFVATTFLAPRARADNVSDFLAKWDPDNDRTLDLAEINKAADAQFDALDADHDGSLSRKELGDRVTKAEFSAADADHDGSLSKGEYATIVAKRFHAANRDKDTTIEITELKTAAGRSLMRLLQ